MAKLEKSTEPDTSQSAQNDPLESKHYVMDLRLFLLLITTSMLTAFALGIYLGPLPASMLPLSTGDVGGMKPQEGSAGGSNDGEKSGMKPISDQTITKKLHSKRRMPTAHSADLGRTVVEQRHVQYQRPSLESLGDADEVEVSSFPPTSEEKGEKGEHLPAGQHLLVDIRNVEAEFLNSEERLAEAMVETVKHAKLTLLSYHCHSLVPAGVSCVGVLLESHISFHTWPEEGVITLDLFTCGSNPLISVVPVIEKLFGIPRKTSSMGNETCEESCPVEEVEVFWSHELRGFRHYEDRKAHYLDLQSDLALWVTSPLDVMYKKEIVSVTSPYQRIDIWDLLDAGETPSWEDAQRLGLKPGDPRWMDTKYASPARLLFLDGTIQSISDNEREYHEALVHPAMFANPNPRNVAIIGGGEGATLREVLKHKTVESVKMIELDEMMVNIAKQYLPYFNNCSMFSEYESCFDDPRAELLLMDGRKWFMDRFGPAKTIETDSDKFDVVVIDALDPEEDKPASAKLYSDEKFLQSLYDALTDQGVLVVQVGTAPNIHDPKADVGVYAKREKMFRMLERNPDTAAMLVYEEAHCGFNEPHSFLVVCKSASCREQWYAGSDAIDFQIYERIFPSKDKERPTLTLYDGSTQYTYQFPPRAWETVYCRREPEPYECKFRGLDLSKTIHELDLDSEEENSFEVTRDEDGTTHVYAIVDIEPGDYVMANDLASSLVVTNPSKENLVANTQLAGVGSAVIIEDLLKYIDKHGHTSLTEGVKSTVVEVGGSSMIRKVSTQDEANLDRIRPLPKGTTRRPPYSPVLDRHRHSFDVFLVATRKIEKGEELLKYENVWSS